MSGTGVMYEERPPGLTGPFGPDETWYGEGFVVVPGEDPVPDSAVVADRWTLVLREGEPLAFLSPAADREAQAARTGLDYLASVESAYLADSMDPSQVFDTHLAVAEVSTAVVVVMDAAALRALGRHDVELLPVYQATCQLHHSVAPGRHCNGCVCARRHQSR